MASDDELINLVRTANQEESEYEADDELINIARGAANIDPSKELSKYINDISSESKDMDMLMENLGREDGMNELLNVMFSAMNIHSTQNFRESFPWLPQ
jgi:hypothetical protein